MARLLERRPRINLYEDEWGFIDAYGKGAGGLTDGEVLVSIIRGALRLIHGLTPEELAKATARIRGA